VEALPRVDIALAAPKALLPGEKLARPRAERLKAQARKAARLKVRAPKADSLQLGRPKGARRKEVLLPLQVLKPELKVVPAWEPKVVGMPRRPRPRQLLVVQPRRPGPL
jgi:hypothetical protein